jgi:hypothetical protein
MSINISYSQRHSIHFLKSPLLDGTFGRFITEAIRIVFTADNGLVEEHG